MISYFARKRATRAAHRVWSLLLQGDVEAGFSLYAQEFTKKKQEAPPALTAACQLQRWIAQPQDSTAAQALSQLATAAPQNSHIRLAWALVQQTVAEKDLAGRLRDTTGEDLDTPTWMGLRKKVANGGKENPCTQVFSVTQYPVAAAVPEGAPLQALALALLALRHQAAGAARGRAVIGVLPKTSALPEPLRRGCTRLLVQAAVESGQWNQAFGAADTLAALEPLERFRTQSIMAYGMGQAALRRGDAAAARKALAALGETAGSASPLAVVVHWGEDAMSAGAAEIAAEWFQAHAQEQHQRNYREPSVPALALGSALGLLAGGYMAEARLQLASISNLAETSSDVVIQATLISALSWLAGCSRADAGDAVGNRALWREAHTHIQKAIASLDHASPGVAWRAELLRGLLAWADQGALPDPAALAAFSDAVANAGAGAGNALRSVEAALLARSRAAEEALDLLRRGDTGRLRELRASVLSAQAAAVPPAIRAAVALHLWQNDPAEDPLPELLELARNTSAPWLDTAIREVRTTQLIARLSEACRHPDRDTDTLPSLGLLSDFEPALRSRAQLVLAALALRRNDVRAAQEALAQVSPGADGEIAAELRCHVAWHQQDANAALHALSTGEESPRLSHLAGKRPALRVVSIRKELGDDRGGAAVEHLHTLAQESGMDEAMLLCRIVLWLLEKRSAPLAGRLLRAARAGHVAESPVLAWVTHALESLCAAAQEQYAGCVKAADELLGSPAPDPHATGSAEGDSCLAGWVRVLRLEAQVASLADSPDAAARWRTARTDLLAEAAKVTAPQEAVAVARLIAGLLIHASGGDLQADDQTILHLAEAQRTLNLAVGTRFVDSVMQDLNWRRSRMEAFWTALRNYDYAGARRLFHEDLLPACRQRVPAALRAAGVLADWAAHALEGPTALRQIAALETQEGGIAADTARRMEAVLKDGIQARDLLRLLQERRHDVIEERTRTLEWLDIEKGKMPQAVAAIQLLALYRQQKMEDVAELAGRLATRNMPQWLSEASRLLLGYAHFARKQFAQAAQTFAQIESAVVQGHSIARAEAASEFNNGVQLLGVDQKSRAFEAFARALSGTRDAETNHAKLAPLFLHFGLEAINTGRGARARQAFSLIDEVLEQDTEDSPEARASRFTAQLGTVLCDALTVEDVEEIGGECFLKLHMEVQDLDAAAEKDGQPLDWPEWFRKNFGRVTLVLAVCQELRRERRREPRMRQKQSRLRSYLFEQAEALEDTADKDTPRDPLVKVLKGVVRLRLDRKSAEEGAALEEIQEALRLGVQSTRLVAVLEGHRKSLEEFRKRVGTSVDLLDFWLTSPDVPGRIKDPATQNDDIRELFRLHRHYAPTEVANHRGKSPSDRLGERVKRLTGALEADDLKDDALLRKKNEHLHSSLEALRRAEETVLTAERETLQMLAAKLRTERLPS